MAIETAPWTVKGLRKDIREAVTRQSRKAGVSVAEWIATAVTNQIAREAGTVLLPPPGNALDRQPQQAEQSRLDLGDLPAALSAMASAQAAGLPVSKAAVRGVVGLIRQEVRAARGGLPKTQIGQTISHDP